MSSTQRSMLVVDDDADTCSNLSDIFSDLGYRVETAPNGPAALEKVRHDCFDIALLDLMMPGMDGLALFRQLRSLYPQTTAVLMTGEPHDPRAAECLQAGMNCMIPKPLDIPNLASALKKIVRQCSL